MLSKCFSVAKAGVNTVVGNGLYSIVELVVMLKFCIFDLVCISLTTSRSNECSGQRQTILLVNGEPLGRERVNNVKNYVPINPFPFE